MIDFWIFPLSTIWGEYHFRGIRAKIVLLKLGFVIVILKHIYLSFMTFQPIFYLCYIYYSGSLILCCQYVATSL